MPSSVHIKSPVLTGRWEQTPCFYQCRRPLVFSSSRPQSIVGQGLLAPTALEKKNKVLKDQGWCYRHSLSLSSSRQVHFVTEAEMPSLHDHTETSCFSMISRGALHRAEIWPGLGSWMHMARTTQSQEKKIKFTYLGPWKISFPILPVVRWKINIFVFSRNHLHVFLPQKPKSSKLGPHSLPGWLVISDLPDTHTWVTAI